MNSEHTVEGVNPIRFIIKNYQAVEHIDITVDGFTVIKGESEIGKSALMRAIYSALTNEFGSSFIRHGESKCYVMIHFLKKNFKIEWFKTKKESHYILNDDTENPYRKLNRDIPQLMKEFGIGKLLLKGGKLKLFPQLCADQHNTPFFIFEDDPEKAEILAEISKTTKVVKARKLVGKDVSAKKAILKAESIKFLKMKEVVLELKRYDLKALKEETSSIYKRTKKEVLQIQEDQKVFSSYESLKKFLESLKILKGFKELDLNSMGRDSLDCSNRIKTLLDYLSNKSLCDSIGCSLSPLKILVSLDLEELRLLLKTLLEYNSHIIIVDLNIEGLKEVFIPTNLIPLKEDIDLLFKHQKSSEFIEALSKDSIDILDLKHLDTSLNLLRADIEVYNDFILESSIYSSLDKKGSLLSFPRESLESCLSDFKVDLSIWNSYDKSLKEEKAYNEEMIKVQMKLKDLEDEISEYEFCPLCKRSFDVKK